MSKIVKWIKENKFFSTYLLILIFLIPIISINYLYTISKNAFFSNLGISVDGLITYIAGFEAFIGTVFLGVVAAHQNEEAIKQAHEANKLSNKLIDIEAQRDARFLTPNLILSNISQPRFFHQSNDADIEYFDNLHVSKNSIVEDPELYATLNLTLLNSTSLTTQVHFYMFDVLKIIPRRYFNSFKINKADVTLAPRDLVNFDISFPLRELNNNYFVDLCVSLDLVTEFNDAFREFILFVMFCDDNGLHFEFRENKHTRIA